MKELIKIQLLQMETLRYIVNEIFKTNVPEGDDYATLSGLLHERLQDIPQEGDKVEVEDLRIVVEKVSKNIPQKIRIEKIRT